MIFGTLTFGGCGGQPLALVRNIRVKNQMPITPEHAFEEKSTKLLILLALRTVYNRTFQCGTPCSKRQKVCPSLKRICKNCSFSFLLTQKWLNHRVAQESSQGD